MKVFPSLRQQLTSSLRGSLLLLALLGNASVVLAQAAPAANRYQVEPGTKVYLDGKLSTPAAISAIPNAAVASVEGMSIHHIPKKEKLRSYQFNRLVITTKANANSPATLALADKLHLSSAYTTQPAPISIIAPQALAYITSHYPKYWLGGEVLEMTRKSTGEVKYQVQLAGNWGWRYVSFTRDGAFVTEEI